MGGLKTYVITYLDDKDEEHVLSVNAATADAAAKYCGIPMEKIVDVEEVLKRATY